MGKLPVFKTVGRTFGFVVERRFFSLLRLIWLPALLSLVIGMSPLLYQIQVYGFPPDPDKLDAMNADGILNGLNIANFIFSIILSAMIAISVHRMILLDDVQKGVYFYWRLTREEWLYVAAWFLYFIIVLLFAGLPWAGHFYWVATHEAQLAAPALPKVGDVEALKAFMKAFDDPRVVVVGCMSVLLALIALARFGLVFPIIVAEGRLSFARSWSVTRGNFLRLVGFWIVVTILTYVLALVLIAILAVAVAGMVGGVMAGGKTVGALSIIVLAVPAAVSLLVYLVLGITMFIAAMSFTYKALTESSVEDEETEGLPALA